MAGGLAGFDGPRACDPYELPLVMDLVNLVMRVLNTPAGQPTRWPTFGWDYPHIYHPGNIENIRVVARDGRIATTIGIYSTPVRTPRGMLMVGGINAMATHPDFRRHGLGAAVLADAEAKMRADGHQIGLLGTRIQDWYRKMDWETAGEQWQFALDRGNVEFLPDPAGLEVIDEWRPHVAALCALRDAEGIGANRDARLWTLLAERRLRRVFVALRDGRPIAYAGVGGAGVTEYAGPAEVVASLIRAVFARLDDTSVHTSERPPGQRATLELGVTTPVADDGLPSILSRLGLPRTLAYQGMIKILDAPGLFSALGLTPEVSLDRVGAGWRVGHCGRHHDLTDRQLVKLVFGPERFVDFASDLFPVPFYQWPVDHV
jgi:GNAT superfamily N-acetyltransferase